MCGGSNAIGIFHGMKSYFCQDKYGQIAVPMVKLLEKYGKDAPKYISEYVKSMKEAINEKNLEKFSFTY